jgi:hypothetical protein
MSGFVSSIVRGAGFTIGRNLVGDFGKFNKNSTSGRYYDRAENSLEKALNFPIKGRSETILGNCFNLYQEFDTKVKESFGVAFDILIRGNKLRYYAQTIEKFKDCVEYLELKNENDENISKVNEIKDRVNELFTSWINTLSNGILLLKTSKDLETARNGWFGYEDEKNTYSTLKELYTQCDNDIELITKIEDHIKKKPILSSSSFVSVLSTLIGLTVGIYGMLWIIKMIKG